MPTKLETLAALDASIKHWQENAAVEDPYQATMDADSCALCMLFFDNRCMGCPVASDTGDHLCLGSPYVPALNVWKRRRLPGSSHPAILDELKTAWRKAASAEVKYLTGLRRKLADGVEETSGGD